MFIKFLFKNGTESFLEWIAGDTAFLIDIEVLEHKMGSDKLFEIVECVDLWFVHVPFDVLFEEFTEWSGFL